MNGPEGGRMFAQGELEAINKGETIPVPDAIPEGEKAGNFQDEDEAEDDSVNRDLAPGDFSGAVAGEGQEPEELKKAA